METHNTVRMGYGEADITPMEPVQLVGFYRPDNRSRGVRDPLRLQALVWESGRERGCLLTVDSLGFTVELTGILRDRAAGMLHIQREQVMVCFSHTHSAPNAAEEPDYFEMVCRCALKAADQAAENMVAKLAAWGIGKSCIGLNRRNEPDQEDDRLGILKLVSVNGQGPEVLLLRVNAHANVLSGDNWLISADYFGEARKRLEEKYGCKVMMVQGAAGDIRPRFRQDNAEYVEIHCFDMAGEGFPEEYTEKYTAQSRIALEEMADSICGSVDSVAGTLDPRPLTRVGIHSSFCRFAADVPSEKQAADITEEAGREGNIDGRMWLEEVKRLRNEGIKSQYGDIEIQYLYMGEGCLCGVPNEAMCRIGLDIYREAGEPLLFFNGYTNGCSSYLPAAGEYDKGGYEVLWSSLVYFPYHGRVMPLNRDTAEVLAGEVVRTWKEMEINRRKEEEAQQKEV